MQNYFMDALWKEVEKLDFPNVGIGFERHLNDEKIVGLNPAANSKLTISHDSQEFTIQPAIAQAQQQVNSRQSSPKYAKTVEEALSIIREWANGKV